jgi:hypothetical protein
MNGPSSALDNVEIKIRGDRDDDDRNYYPAEDNHDEVVRCVARAINAVIKKLPNCSTVRFRISIDPYYQHFKD